MTFEGFPVAALDFYDDLEMDNTKSFWEANKHIYLESVRTPMMALMEALGNEFGGESPRVFRPHRDVRFSKDKTPYKTHQGAFVGVAPATGFYVQVGAPGVRTGVGFYEASPARLASFREAISHDKHGPELERIVKKLQKADFELGGDRLKTSPRGYDIDHPRIELLRHRSLTLGRDHGFAPYIHTSELLDKVREDWRRGKRLVDWVLAHIKG